MYMLFSTTKLRDTPPLSCPRLTNKEVNHRLIIGIPCISTDYLLGSPSSLPRAVVRRIPIHVVVTNGPWLMCVWSYAFGV